MGSVTVNPPKTPVTEGSSGIAAATVPNICKMPGPPAPFVPTPLPNIGKSDKSPKDYSKNVIIEGKKVAIKGATFKSMGDAASQGTGGGLISSNVEGPTSFVGPGSMDVKIEGKNVQLLGDPMLNNGGPSGSPPNAATLMGLVQTPGALIRLTDGKCDICEKKKHSPLEEKQATRVDAKLLASRVTAMVRAKPGRKLSTMLGVMQCKCGKKYADHSRATLIEVAKIIRDLGWNPPTGMISIDQSRGAKNRAAEAWYPQFHAQLSERLGDKVKGPLEKGMQAFERSNSNRKLPAAYPPGACAAQKTVFRAVGDGAYPEGITERSFSSAGKPLEGEIEFMNGEGQVVVQQFPDGVSVPPCKTCVIMLPVILCPEDKEEQCSHPKT